MDPRQAAEQGRVSRGWLEDALSLGLIRGNVSVSGEWDVPEDEVAFIRRTHRWLPHLVDAVAAQQIGTAVLFGHDGAPPEPGALDSTVLTDVDDAERALSLNAVFSQAARRDIYVLTWSTALMRPAIVRRATATGRVLRDADGRWRDFVRVEYAAAGLATSATSADRDRVNALLRQWAQGARS